MGRNPTEKPRVKCRKGLWSPDEDERLRSYILRHGHGCWGSLPVKAGIQRNGKSCRLRWINYLRPGLKRGIFTPQEEEIILILHRTLGNKWSQIAQHLPGRTDNDIKNHWHSYLKDKKIESETEEAKEGRQTKPPTTNPVTRVSSFESLVSGEGSSPASSESRQSSLSRLVFTEWLTMDNNISVDQHTSVYLNRNEGFTSANCFNSEMQGSNVYNRDTPSSLCKTNVNDDYDNNSNNNNVGNYMVMNVSNEPEIKLEGDEHDADTLALIGSIFGDEMYNNLFV